MEVVFRINQNYLNGKLTHCGGGDITVFKTAVDFWNKTFNIDFFTLRKKLRRISSDI